jgi:hypothetical protein
MTTRGDTNHRPPTPTSQGAINRRRSSPSILHYMSTTTNKEHNNCNNLASPISKINKKFLSYTKSKQSKQTSITQFLCTQSTPPALISLAIPKTSVKPNRAEVSPQESLISPLILFPAAQPTKPQHSLRVHAPPPQRRVTGYFLPRVHLAATPLVNESQPSPQPVPV